MELMKKQMVEKNRMAFIVAVLVTSIETILAVLSFSQAGTNMLMAVVRTVVCVAALATLIVMFNKDQSGEAFETICIITLIAVYAVYNLTVIRVDMYAFMFPILYTMMVYMHPKWVMVGGVAFSIVNAIKLSLIHI